MKRRIAALIMVLLGIGAWFVFRSAYDVRDFEKPAPPEVAVEQSPTTDDITIPEVNFPENPASIENADAGSVQFVTAFDGEIRLRISSVDALSRVTPFHEEPIATYYDWLAEAASAGDTDAALELGFVLLRCVGYATKEDELKEKIDRMNQTHLIGNATGQSERLVDDIQPYIEIEQRRYEVCNGLSNEQIMSSDEWFDLAAEFGDYFAQAGAMERALEQFWLSGGLNEDVESFEDISQEFRRFAEQQPQEFQKALRHAEKARQRGSVQALRDLATLYSGNAMQPTNSYSSTANAYAHLLAASEVFKQIWGPGSYTYHAELRSMSTTLSKYELEWAEAQARSILREPNCCSYP